MYVKNCHECQSLKSRHEFKAHLGDVLEPTAPFDFTAMDIVGPFPITASKNRYLLTFMDHLTHYAEALPNQEMTAQQCARAYASHIIARHGAGSKLITDQGRNFTSAFFRETCKNFRHETAVHDCVSPPVEREAGTKKLVAL